MHAHGIAGTHDGREVMGFVHPLQKQTEIGLTQIEYGFQSL
jgi:hypothetical protein